MYPAKGPATPQRSGYSQFIDGLPKAIAIGVTFFIAPIFFQITIGAVQEFTANHYGPSWVSVGSLLWVFISAAVVYWPVQGFATEFLLKRGINNLIR